MTFLKHNKKIIKISIGIAVFLVTLAVIFIPTSFEQTYALHNTEEIWCFTDSGQTSCISSADTPDSHLECIAINTSSSSCFQLEEEATQLAQNTNINAVEDLIDDLGINDFNNLLDDIDTDDLIDLVNDIGVNDLADLINDMGLEDLTDLIDDLGINDLTDLINSIGLDDFTSLLNDLGLDDFTSLIEELGGEILGDLFNEIGVGSLEELLDVFGIIGLGDIVGEIGETILGSVLDAVGVSGFIDSIVGEGGLGAVLGGALGDLADSLLGGIFGGGGGGGVGDEEGLCGTINPEFGREGNPSANIGRSRLYVPVKDFEAEGYLQAILGNSDRIGDNTRVIQFNTDAARQYLRLLCIKEYVHDPNRQHAWTEVIGIFVNKVLTWVKGAYDGNPIYLANQYIYYDLVDNEIFITFLQEIRDSNIGETTKRETLIAIIREKFAYVFPYNLEHQLAPDDIAAALSEDYTAAGGAAAFYKLINRSGESTLSAQVLAKAEFSRRRAEGIEFEREKLAWGRGFFSYESCELKIFTPYDEDRRNCRILTPGSLIQDQTAFVLGSALRQMELADEFEESISDTALLAIGDILGTSGLGSKLDNFSDFDIFGGDDAIRPSTAEIYIDGFFDSRQPSLVYPSEFDEFVTGINNADIILKRTLDRAFDVIRDIPSLDLNSF